MIKDPNIVVNRASPVPLYFQVAEQMEAAIKGGRLVPGDRIDNELLLASKLGLSRPTMRQAIQTLVNKGMLVRRRGVGTQVVEGQIHRPVKLSSLLDDMRAAGRHPSTQVLAVEVRRADHRLAEILKLDEGDGYWYLERLRRVDDEPLAIMTNHLPLALMNMAQVDLEAIGLYEALRNNAIQVRVAHQQIGARKATTREARLLGITAAIPLVTMARTGYDDTGRIVEFGQHCYRADQYTFDITLVDR